MASRNFKNDEGHYSQGKVYLEFSFASNNTTNPVITGASSTLRGAVAPSDIASIVYGATGEYTVTLADKFRYCIAKRADLEETATQDGAYATLSAVSNEGSATLAPTFIISLFAATGVATAYTARRVSVFLVMKNSNVGA